MPKKKPYTFYWCRDCDVDFITSKQVKKACCPSCADSIYVQSVRDIWLERPFNYKRPWTSEEDEILLICVGRGMTHVEIGETIDRTGKAVTRRLSQLRRSVNESKTIDTKHC
ncbi:hypothetical protein [Oceanobacillus jeddahense]|uniref:hypothetical protein n=1 Tax=Oceanobacillus jeddahense TaxID=1462527 RepID=UPI000596186D|nr:hypothetical protein [Oceanobacillus jeddahense]